MSTTSFKWNNRIYWDVLCSHEKDGEVHTYLFHSYESAYSEALVMAKRVYVHSHDPSFKAEVVGIRFT